MAEKISAMGLLFLEDCLGASVWIAQSLGNRSALCYTCVVEVAV